MEVFGGSMKKIFLLFVVCLTLNAQAVAENKLIILGDSLTEGYGVSKEAAFPSLLEKKIKSSGKNWTVINAGISGSTTASGQGRIKWLLKSNSEKPKLILVILGANDGLRGIKPSESEKNLSQMIEMIQKEKIEVVLGGVYMPPNYGKDYTEKFKKIYSDVSTQYKIKLIPFILEGVGGVSHLNLADGIHPNEKGHQIVADNIYKAIKESL
jgi:acyl-CoA thioesterase-1